MRSSILCAIVFVLCALPLFAQDTAMVRAADGFQLPVGPNGTGEGYYIARGYRPNGHLGEDWNGVHGGDTDLGDPVYACANGYVTFARNYHVGWGNVVILRHAYYEGSALKYCDSLYGHLLDFSVQEGQQVRRGQQIGRIGNNFGMYEAHLHFEMRKNLQIGMYRSSFLRDFSNYYTPNVFIAEHRACPNGNHMASIPINTYPAAPPPVIAGPHVETPVFGPPPAGAPSRFSKILPLPPAGAAPAPAPTPAVKVITKASTPTPAPSKAVAAAPPPTPAPTPIVRAFRTGVSTLSNTSPTPSTAADDKRMTAANSTAEPTVEIITASKTSTAATTLAPPPKSSKATASAATPTPAGKAGKKPSASASVAANKTRKSPTASPTPQPVVAAKGESQVILSDPLLPTPTTKDTPIQRTGSTYKVDRFEDLHKAGF